MFSFYYPSRLNFHLANGKRYDNENLRTDVHSLTYKDGYSGQYSYVYIDRSPDVGTTDFGSCPASGKAPKKTKSKSKSKPKSKSKSTRPSFTG
jgi:hypothetical protein